MTPKSDATFRSHAPGHRNRDEHDFRLPRPETMVRGCPPGASAPDRIAAPALERLGALHDAGAGRGHGKISPVHAPAARSGHAQFQFSKIPLLVEKKYISRHIMVGAGVHNDSEHMEILGFFAYPGSEDVYLRLPITVAALRRRSPCAGVGWLPLRLPRRKASAVCLSIWRAATMTRFGGFGRCIDAGCPKFACA